MYHVLEAFVVCFLLRHATAQEPGCISTGLSCLCDGVPSDIYRCLPSDSNYPLGHSCTYFYQCMNNLDCVQNTCGCGPMFVYSEDTKQCVSKPECPAGWFGSECQYNCMCMNDKCNDDGTCQDGAKCEHGWFGPACQYVNIANRGTVIVSKDGSNHQSEISTVLTDGDDTTCLDYPSYIIWHLYLDDHYHINWLRFRVKRPEDRYTIGVNFRGESTSIGRRTLPCNNLKRTIVDDHTVDIHCDVSESVVMLSPTGGVADTVCSLYVSGGRNIALKQPASQSTTYTSSAHPTTRDFQANNSVDGVRATNIWHDSCSHTIYGDPNPWWAVNFTRTYLVNRFVLYDREKDQARLQAGFRLQGYTANQVRAVDYTEDAGEYQVKYQIIPSSPVSIESLLVTPTPRYRTMQMCEVEIYGDTSCEPGKYGRDCEHTCNCANDEPCLVSTGGCPSGCAAGYTGEDCQSQA